MMGNSAARAKTYEPGVLCHWLACANMSEPWPFWVHRNSPPTKQCASRELSTLSACRQPNQRKRVCVGGVFAQRITPLKPSVQALFPSQRSAGAGPDFVVIRVDGLTALQSTRLSLREVSTAVGGWHWCMYSMFVCVCGREKVQQTNA